MSKNITPKKTSPAALAAHYAAPRGRSYGSFLETIGGTPLVGVPILARKLGLKAEILLKLEFFNPLASVKDRAGYAMILEAEKAGTVTPGKTILVEPTSGNTGISLAGVAAARGYRLIVTMPESASIERRKMMGLLGAEIVLTEAAQGMKGAIAKAEEIAAKQENAWIPRQFENPANPLAHEVTTAPEIWADTGGEVDAVVAGIGTGGTITGISRGLKARNPKIEIIGVEPAESPFLTKGSAGPHKIQGLGAGFKPENLDLKAVDKIMDIASQTAFETARMIARTEGLPVGISSGAALAAALKLAQEPAYKGKKIVVIMPSFAERYISTPLFEGV